MTIRLILDVNATVGAEVTVTGPELGYLAGVRRARCGEVIEVLSNGTASLARVVELKPRGAVLRFDAVDVRRQDPLEVELAVAVPKRGLMEEVVRASSELGIKRVVPILAARSVMEPGAPRLDRWQRVAQESMRQCGRTVPLTVDEPMSLADYLAHSGAASAIRLVLHPTSPHRFPSRLPQGEPLRVLIGPEGGLTDDELASAVDRGFLPVALGSTVLRIETAAVAAAVLAAAVAGSWLSNVD